MTTSAEARAGPGRPRDPDLAQQRREAILRQAIVHFAREGFPKADMGAIAEAAGCAKGTIYNYFSSKRELFRTAVDHVMEKLLEATSSSSSENPIERFGHAIRSFLAYFDAHPEYIELLIQERAEFRDSKTPTYQEYCKVHRERAHAQFKMLIATGRFREVPVERTLDIMGDLLYGTIFTNYFKGRDISLEQQAADITDILLHGLLASK